jgi:hypothetical protein
MKTFLISQQPPPHRRTDVWLFLLVLFPLLKQSAGQLEYNSTTESQQLSSNLITGFSVGAVGAFVAICSLIIGLIPRCLTDKNDFIEVLTTRSPFAASLAKHLGTPLVPNAIDWVGFCKLADLIESIMMDRFSFFNGKMALREIHEISRFIAFEMKKEPEYHHLVGNTCRTKGYRWVIPENHQIDHAYVLGLVYSIRWSSLKVISEVSEKKRLDDFENTSAQRNYISGQSDDYIFPEYQHLRKSLRDWKAIGGLILALSSPEKQAGFGKTEELRRFYHECKQKNPGECQVWIDARNRDLLNNSLVSITDELTNMCPMTEREKIFYALKYIASNASLVIVYRPRVELLLQYHLLQGVRLNRQLVICLTSDRANFSSLPVKISGQVVFHPLSIVTMNSYLNSQLAKKLHCESIELDQLAFLRMVTRGVPLYLNLVVGVILNSALTIGEFKEQFNNLISKKDASTISLGEDKYLDALISIVFNQLNSDYPAALQLVKFCCALRNHHLPNEWKGLFLRRLHRSSSSADNDNPFKFKLGVVMRQLLNYRLALLSPNYRLTIRKSIANFYAKLLHETKEVSSEGYKYAHEIVFIFNKECEDLDEKFAYPHIYARYAEDLKGLLKRYRVHFLKDNFNTYLQFLYFSGRINAYGEMYQKASKRFYMAFELIESLPAGERHHQHKTFITWVKIRSACAAADMGLGLYIRADQTLQGLEKLIQEQLLSKKGLQELDDLISWGVRVKSSLFEVKLYLGEIVEARNYLNLASSLWFKCALVYDPISKHERADLGAINANVWVADTRQLSIKLYQQNASLDLIDGIYERIGALAESMHGLKTTNIRAVWHVMRMYATAQYLRKDQSDYNEVCKIFRMLVNAKRDIKAMAIYGMILLKPKNLHASSSEADADRMDEAQSYFTEILERPKEIAPFTIFNVISAIAVEPIQSLLLYNDHVTITPWLIAFCLKKHVYSTLDRYYYLVMQYHELAIQSELVDTAYSLLVIQIIEDCDSTYIEIAELACHAIYNEKIRIQLQEKLWSDFNLSGTIKDRLDYKTSEPEGSIEWRKRLIHTIEEQRQEAAAQAKAQAQTKVEAAQRLKRSAKANIPRKQSFFSGMKEIIKGGSKVSRSQSVPTHQRMDSAQGLRNTPVEFPLQFSSGNGSRLSTQRFDAEGGATDSLANEGVYQPQPMPILGGSRDKHRGKTF